MLKNEFEQKTGSYTQRKTTEAKTLERNAGMLERALGGVRYSDTSETKRIPFYLMQGLGQAIGVEIGRGSVFYSRAQISTSKKDCCL